MSRAEVTFCNVATPPVQDDIVSASEQLVLRENDLSTESWRLLRLPEELARSAMLAGGAYRFTPTSLGRSNPPIVRKRYSNEARYSGNVPEVFDCAYFGLDSCLGT